MYNGGLKVVDTQQEIFKSNVLVLKPSTRPKDEAYQMFVAASIPTASYKINLNDLEELKAHYNNELTQKTVGDRLCIILLCKEAQSLEETGRIADQLQSDIIDFLHVQPKIMSCGYAVCCEKIGEPFTAMRRALSN